MLEQRYYQNLVKEVKIIFDQYYEYQELWEEYARRWGDDYRTILLRWYCHTDRYGGMEEVGSGVRGYPSSESIPNLVLTKEVIGVYEHLMVFGIMEGIYSDIKELYVSGVCSTLNCIRKGVRI